MDVVLLVPAAPRISTRLAIRPQLPLGHVLIGSALRRKGVQVRLLNADHASWSLRSTVANVLTEKPAVVLLGHPSSTIAHNSTVAIAKALRNARPDVILGYGGVFPSFFSSPFDHGLGGLTDVVFQGEAEESAMKYVTSALASPHCHSRPETPRLIRGEVIRCLDDFAPDHSFDWDLTQYKAFGEQSAVVQFSRGCPRRCAYCGQWSFWRQWRHRSIESFCREIEELYALGTRIFWVADENWAIDRRLFYDLLERLSRVGRGKKMIVTMECAHLIRDAEDSRLYKESGIAMIMLGYDGGGTFGEQKFNFRASDLARAVERYRRAGILVVMNYFVNRNLEFRAEVIALRRMRAHFYNILFPTAHYWTEYGKSAPSGRWELDRADYRTPPVDRETERIALRFIQKRMEVLLHWDVVWKKEMAGRLYRRSICGMLSVFFGELLMLIADILRLVLRKAGLRGCRKST